MTPREAAAYIAAAWRSTYGVRLAHARAITRDACATDRPVIAFSGGKDSCIVAALARAERPDAPLMFVDTGLTDPALREWVDAFGGDHLVTVTPDVLPVETWASGAACLPVGSKMSARYYKRQVPGVRCDPETCCDKHKTRPAHAWLRAYGCTALLVGVRAGDSGRHKFKMKQGALQAPRAGRPWAVAYPVLTWLPSDVARFMASDVPDWRPIVPPGQRADLGCLPCLVNIARAPGQAHFLREHRPDWYRRAMVDPPDGLGFGVDVLMIVRRESRDEVRAYIEATGWPAILASGELDQLPLARRGMR